MQARAECAIDTYVSWLSSRNGGDVQSFATQFGCGVGWRTQLALAYSELRARDQTTRSLLVTGKTSMTDPRDDGAGLSLAYGAPAESTAGAATRIGDLYATLAGSLPLANKLMVHANLGWTGSLRRAASTTRWAVALDHAYSEKFHLVAETFADDHDHRSWVQTGAAYTLDESFSLNASFGRQVRSGTKAITMGIIFVF